MYQSLNITNYENRMRELTALALHYYHVENRNIKLQGK